MGPSFGATLYGISIWLLPASCLAPGARRRWAPPPAISVFPSLSPWLALNLKNAVLLNVILAVFNMLPLPPLDGGRIVTGLLPRSLALPFSRLEPFGLP